MIATRELRHQFWRFANTKVGFWLLTSVALGSVAWGVREWRGAVKEREELTRHAERLSTEVLARLRGTDQYVFQLPGTLHGTFDEQRTQATLNAATLIDILMMSPIRHPRIHNARSEFADQPLSEIVLRFRELNPNHADRINRMSAALGSVIDRSAEQVLVFEEEGRYASAGHLQDEYMTWLAYSREQIRHALTFLLEVITLDVLKQ